MLVRTNGEFFGETCQRKSVEGLSLLENRYSPAQFTPLHTHEAMLLYFVLEGACKEKTQRKTTLHSPSTLVFLPAGEAHSTLWSEGSAGFCFHLELTASYWSSRSLEKNALLSAGVSSISQGPSPILMRKLYAEFLRWDQFSPLIAEGMVLELLGHFARALGIDKTRAGQWLPLVEACLRDNPGHPPSLTELAALADVHPSHLVRAFRQQYHTTPGEFVRHLRIEEACRRLRRTPEIPLGELALELGFSDQSHFARSFRRKMGVSPGAYRRIKSDPRK